MERSPPQHHLPASHISQISSKKRVFPGSSSACTEEIEMVESSPLVNRNSMSKLHMQKNEVIRPCPTIKDVDMDEEPADFALASIEVNMMAKGKATLAGKRKLWTALNMVDSNPKVAKTESSIGNGDVSEPCPDVHTSMNEHGDSDHKVEAGQSSYQAGQSSYHSGFFDSTACGTSSDDEMSTDSVENDDCSIAVESSNLWGLSSHKKEYGAPDVFLKNYDLFKKFDTVEDYSDHHYSRNGSSKNQPSKSWVRKIQEEWRILEKDLPDTIFVRVYESRMDLLRAVMIGAEGTPYHDGLFFFDVFFPASYPSIPPHVFFHSGGLHINPNLYSNGKVCLSLLNTWVGNPKEKWIPGVSTVLQVLVSIQALILNAKPYFNEPAHENESHTTKGVQNSVQYNEDIFIYSIKTMVYSIRNPPKNFEDFVAGHFYRRGRDVLGACKSYMDGAEVGSLVKGMPQGVDEGGDKSSSLYFKDALAKCIKILVEALTQVGYNDCQDFLSLVV